MFNKEVRLFTWVWIAVGITLTLMVGIGVYKVKTAESEYNSTWFQVNRLSKINHNGLVVVGTSLVQHGFYYDENFDRFALQEGLSVECVRFTLSGGKLYQYVDLLNPILKAKPRLVIIQINPFISEEKLQNRVLRQMHFLLDSLKQRVKNMLGVDKFVKYSNFQDDSVIESKLRTRCKSLPVRHPFISEISKVPAAYEKFFSDARALGIKVVFLQMTNSITVEQQAGKQSIDEKKKLSEAVAARYHVPLWVSPCWPLSCYMDGYHLNNEGRVNFNKWVLQKIKQEIFVHE